MVALYGPSALKVVTKCIANPLHDIYVYLCDQYVYVIASVLVFVHSPLNRNNYGILRFHNLWSHSKLKQLPLLHFPFENTDILSYSYISVFNNHMLSDDFYLSGGQSFPSALPIPYKAETRNSVSFNDTVIATRQ